MKFYGVVTIVKYVNNFCIRSSIFKTKRTFLHRKLSFILCEPFSCNAESQRRFLKLSFYFSFFFLSLFILLNFDVIRIHAVLMVYPGFLTLIDYETSWRYQHKFYTQNGFVCGKLGKSISEEVRKAKDVHYIHVYVVNVFWDVTQH